MPTFVPDKKVTAERTVGVFVPDGGPSRSRKKKRRGGILGAISRVPGDVGRDFYNAAVGSPAGVYYMGKAALGDAAELLDPQALANPRGRSGPRLAPRTRPIGEQIVRATVNDLKHPLRNPGNTILDVVGVASLGAGTGARIAGAAGKFREGATLGQAAHALAHRPVVGPRTFKVGDLVVEHPSSRAALTRGAQKVMDRSRQRRADRNPGGRAARSEARRAGSALAESMRIEESIAKAPAAALAAIGKKLKPAEQMALRVVAEEVPLSKRIATTKGWINSAKDAAARRRHEKRLQLLEDARAHILDPDAKPAFHPKATKLNAVYGRMEKVAGSREALGKELGLLTDESIAGRKTAAGRAASGAEWESGPKQVPGQRGVDFGRSDLTGETRVVHRPRTEAEATARVAELDKNLARALKPLIDKAYPPSYRQRVQTLRNASKGAKGKRASIQLGHMLEQEERALIESGGSSIAEDARRSVESALLKLSERADAPAGAKQLGAMIRERNSLEAAKGDVFLGEAGADPYGMVSRDVATARHVAETESQGKGGLVGAEEFTASPGAVYVPDIEQKVGRKGNVGQVGGQGSVGQARSPIRQGYTGAQKRSAREPLNTTRAVAEAQLAVSRFQRLVTLRDKLVKAASSEPRFADDVAVRLDRIGKTERLPKDVRQFLDDPDGLALLAPDEQVGKFEALRSELIVGNDKLIKQMSGDQLAEFHRLHDEGKIGWVPKRLLGDLAKPHAPLQASVGKVPVEVWDTINNAQRLAVLYLKPAYAVPNLLGNAALNLIQQGFAAPRNIAWASAMHWKLGPELTAHVDTLMGEGFAAALRGEQGHLAKATQAAANIWGKGVDRPFRRASFLHEAKRSGFKTRQELEKLLTDPAVHDTLVDVTKRANRQIIDYGRLSSREREIVRRLIFFYPWVKGSTVYAGNMLLEYPAKSAAIGAIGRYGQERSSRELGPAPSYMAGSFKVGDRVVNPASAAILQTPAQIGAMAAGLAGAGPVSDVAEIHNLATPPLQVALNLLAGKNLSSGWDYPRSKRNLPDVAVDTLLQSTPQYRLYQQLTGESQAQLYPPSPRAGAMQFLLGGLYPRKVNTARMRALAQRERRELGR